MAEINILLHAKNGRILENTTTNMRNTLPRPESQLPLTHAQLAPRNHHLLDLSVREIYSSFTDKTVHQHRLWRHHWRRFIFSLSFSRYCSHHKFNGMTKCMRSRLLTLIFGPRQANLLLIAYASSEGSGEPAHPRSLARTSAARSYKQ